MLQRAIFLYGLFVVAVLSTGAAIWQSLETNLREEQLSDTTQLLTAARNEARAFKEKAQLADRRIRVLEAAAANAPIEEATEAASSTPAAVESEAKLRAELAAARQQLAAAETAIRETEDRLASEIAEHADLKTKAQELMDEVAAAGRAIAAAEAKAAATPQQEGSSATSAAAPLNIEEPAVAAPIAPEPATEPASTAANEAPALPAPASTGATGSLPEPSAEVSAERSVTPAAPVTPAVKKVQKKPAKPIIRAVKPIGSPFEPML